MCAYSDYNDVATVTEEMFRDVAQTALGRTTIKRNGEDIDLAKPWRRVTMRELILERFGIDFMQSTREQLAELLDEPIDPAASWAEVVADIYSEKIESTINQPTHVFDFPLEPFPITKRHSEHPELGEHFDAVIGGIELVSGDTELNDPVDQWQRFVDQRKRRAMDDGDVPHPNDEEYARAIEYGYSPTAGGGMGVDRLVMILTERDTLREVIPFPIVRDISMSTAKLDLDPGIIAACRQAAAQIAGQVGERDRQQDDRLGRADVASLIGVDGANELEAPFPNVLVDHVRDRGELGRGIAYWLGNALLDDERPLTAADRRGVDAGKLDLCALPRAQTRTRSASGSPGLRAAPERDRSAHGRSAASCASVWARVRRRCATCSPRPGTCMRTWSTRSRSPRPAGTSSR